MWSDRESEIDYLNFGEVSQLAADIVASPNMLPVSIGIFGNWGAGKSSVLNLIKKELSKEPDNYIIINFDAWLYQGYDDVRAALLEVIATEINRVVSDDSSLKNKARKLLDRVDKFRLLSLTAEGTALAMGIQTGGILSGLVGSIKQLTQSIQDEDMGDIYEESQQIAKEGKDTLNKLVKKPSKSTPPQQINALRREFEDVLKDIDKTLVIIIDNLDRCLPTNAIHTLEATRLFLFLQKTAFIIAADEEMIRNTVAEHFKGSSERHHIDYLDKLIQVPIRVPKVGNRELRSYLFMLFALESGLDERLLEKLRCELESSLQHSWNEEPISREDALSIVNSSKKDKLRASFELADRIAPILSTSPSIHGNPRIVKRLLNVVKMRLQVAKRRDMPLNESIITKLVIFERCAGVEATLELYKLIDEEAGKPKALRMLENKGDKVESELPQVWTKDQRIKDFITKWCEIEPPLSEIDLRPAVYLSRETLPIGIYTTGLSSIGQEILQSLLDTKQITSPTARKHVAKLPHEEHTLVMESIINHLRSFSDWSSQPIGFAGAYLLAEQSSDAGRTLRRFVNNIEDKPIWMNSMIKDSEWLKGV